MTPTLGTPVFPKRRHLRFLSISLVQKDIIHNVITCLFNTFFETKKSKWKFIMTHWLMPPASHLTYGNFWGKQKPINTNSHF